MGKRTRHLRRDMSLTEKAADDIRTRIVFGDIPMGATLSENTLAAELGVSKNAGSRSLAAVEKRRPGFDSAAARQFRFRHERVGSGATSGDLRETPGTGGSAFSDEARRADSGRDLRVLSPTCERRSTAMMPRLTAGRTRNSIAHSSSGRATSICWRAILALPFAFRRCGRACRPTRCSTGRRTPTISSSVSWSKKAAAMR